VTDQRAGRRCCDMVNDVAPKARDIATTHLKLFDKADGRSLIASRH